MGKAIEVTNAEREVLEALWRFPEGIKQSALSEEINQSGKDWARQTINTFLSNLEKKGIVKRERRIVYPLFTKEEFANLQVEEVVEEVYGGLFSNLVLAFSKKNKLTKEDEVQLRKLLESFENDGEQQ